MGIVSKKKSYAGGRAPSDTLVMRAVKELLPKWEKIKDEFQPHQWGWEFQRRNPEYQIVSKILEKKEKEWCDKEKSSGLMQAALALMPEDTRKLILALPALEQRKLYWKLYHPEPAQAVREFGLSIWLKPEEEIPSLFYWRKELIGKHFSESCLHNAYDSEERAFFYSPDQDEEIMVINYNAPYQIFLAEVKKKYKQRGLMKPVPQFHVKKFRQYLQVYDLRTWGEKNGKGQISWDDIASYIYPGQIVSPQRIKGQYAIALRYINGGYKDLIRHKG